MRRLVVCMKPPRWTPVGRSGAVAEAPAKSWLHSRLQRTQGHPLAAHVTTNTHVGGLPGGRVGGREALRAEAGNPLLN